MPIRLDEMETSNNREAEGATFSKTRSVDISDAFMDDETIEGAADNPAEEQAEGEEATTFPLTPPQLMRLIKSAFSQGKTYQEQVLQPRWTASYNAFNNKHASDSKYSSSRFRGRSRLFRPKTRSTARKKMAEAAAALFSTDQAMIIKAGDESNPQQVAGAELTSALIQYRLDRASENSGIPWFQISMGAHLTAMQNTVCISKQYWEYRREIVGYDEIPVQMPVPPHLQPMIGAPSIPTGEVERKPRYKIVRDRPRIDLMPPEDTIRDPAAAWEDQAQDSAYLILRFPMTVEGAKSFLANANEKSAVKFYDVPEETLTNAAGGATDPSNSAVIRRAREHSGTDRLSDFTVDNAYTQVWLHENFLRVDGHDYVFWTLGIDRQISDAIPVEEAYPEQNGARPVVIGVGALEPFKIDPMSPIEAWQEMQREMNDLVNLRLDTLKQTIAPLAKVKRGKSVDIRAIQNRSPDTVVYMQNMDDVEFDRPAGPSSESYLEMEKLNADFDDQAGNFSTGSVQTNRQLGETVGGMQMMQSSANALGEFELRVWVETWVEPVLRQLVKLEQYYESDEKVIALSAKRAKLMPRFNISAVTDEMLTAQVAVSVDVGIGSSDPMLSLQKFSQASQIALSLLTAGAQFGIKRDAVIDEVFGKAGYKDASDRFFSPSDEQDPRIQQLQQALQQMQGQLQEMEQQLKNKDGEFKTRLQVARISAVSGLAKTEMTQQHQAKQQFVDAAMGQVNAHQDRQFQAAQAAKGQQFEQQQGEADRSFQQAQGEASHGRAMEMQQAKGAQQAGPLGLPMPGGGQPQPAQAPNEDQSDMDRQQLHQLLGLEAPPDPAQAMAPVAEAMTQAVSMIAQQMQQQTAMLMRQLQQQNAAMLSAIEQGNQRLVEGITAPKRVVFGPDGRPAGVVSQAPGN